MKKQIFAIAAIGIITSGMLYSCKKDNVPAPETASHQPSVKRLGATHMEYMGVEYPDYVEKIQDCGTGKGTCIPDVVIKPKIFSGILTQGNAVSTGKFFADANNCQYIPTAVLNNATLMEFLSSGSAYSKLLTSSGNKEVYLIGESADLTVNNSLIMPVTLQD